MIYDEKKTNKFAKANANPRVKYTDYITNFRKYVDNYGAQAENLPRIVRNVRDKFHDARKQFLTVHDEDLKRWAFLEAKECELAFKASDNWCTLIKFRNRIVSRKVTKFVTTKEINKRESTKNEAMEFVHTFRESPTCFSYSQVFNTDQSGFSNELELKRTLSDKGEQATCGLIRSGNKMTHSYPIMPIITLSGELLSPMLICLQEQKGMFGHQASIVKNSSKDEHCKRRFTLT